MPEVGEHLGITVSLMDGGQVVTVIFRSSPGRSAQKAFLKAPPPNYHHAKTLACGTVIICGFWGLFRLFLVKPWRLLPHTLKTSVHSLENVDGYFLAASEETTPPTESSQTSC